MPSFFKKIIIYLCYYTGLNFLFGYFGKNKLYVLNFHSIYSEANKEELLVKAYPNLSMPLDQFEARIKYLIQHGHTFIKSKDLASIESKKLRKPTILYFDDGFKDNLVNALPILKKYNIPAIIFISTSLINRQSILWTIKYRLFLFSQGRSDQDIALEIKRFKKQSFSDSQIELENIYQQNNFKINLEHLNIFLSWLDIQELIKNGIEIGSHGLNHDNLLHLSEEHLRQELMESKRIIESKISQPVIAFSFPYGRYNERVLRFAKECGYKLIVSAGSGLNDIASLNSEIFLLKNIPVRIQDSFLAFKVNLYSANIARGKK
ncbi:MAG: polysaccharide deacetylase family protein [bacterium]|nr:polysaccharide deacetylase family protein [bacterium]